MRTGSWTALFLLVLATAAARTAFPESHTLQECIELGLRNSKAVHAAGLRLRTLEAGYAEARTALLPSLLLTARYSRLSPLAAGEIILPAPINKITLYSAIEDTFALTAAFQQPLFSGLRIRSTIAQARAAREEGTAAYRQQQEELLYQIRASFWELAKAGEALKVIRENIAQVNSHLNQIQDFYDQGLVTYNEVLRGRMQLADITLRELEAENAQALLQARLAILIGLPADSLISPEFSLEAEDEPLEPAGSEPGDSLIAAAVQRRPEVAAARQRQEAAQAAVAMARSGWYPSVYLTGGYQYALPNPRQFPPAAEFTSTWDLGIAASLDVGRWPAVARRSEQALAQAAQAREALGQLEDSISLEVIQARLSLKKNAERIRVARQFVAQAEENRKIINERYKNGLALASELMDAQLARLEGDLQLSQARIDLQIARAALARALGE
jgi:outer membrane protein